MILVADSGSTGTDWCLILKDGQQKYIRSIGMNPYNITLTQIKEEMNKAVMPNVEREKITSLHFYGSGCSADVKKIFMQSAMQNFFPNAFIEIEHDLLGAARALCGKEPGIAAILGTGSNSCLYDGKEVIENVPSLGYVLCDEGAGTYIGKLLLTAYLRNQLPTELHQKFQQQYPGTESDFLDELYVKPLPNRFLASFSVFANENKEHPFIKQILNEAFTAFIEKQIKQYTNYANYPIHFVGSIAFHFKDAIEEVTARYGLRVGKIIKEPLNDLVNYHCK